MPLRSLAYLLWLTGDISWITSLLLGSTLYDRNGMIGAPIAAIKELRNPTSDMEAATGRGAWTKRNPES